MLHFLNIIAIVACADFALGMANIILPESVNCGNQAVMTCTSTECNSAYRFVKNDVDIYTNTGPLTSTDPDKYSANVTSNSQVQLTIANIQVTDSGAYACQCEYEALSAYETMNYTCKATTSDATITNEKKLSITVDNLYLQPSRVDTRLTNSSSLLHGMYTCEPSSLLDSYYRCTWVSTASLPDGSCGYTMTVSTETKAVPVSGSFSIVTPTSPTISKLVAISTYRQVLRGRQNTPLEIQCVSSGGIPAPTLAWYRGNTSSSPVTQSSTSDSVQQSDGTYTVTLTHTFTPQREDDMNTFLCLVFYPGATIEASPNPSPATTILYLDLTPDFEEVSQTSEAVSGESIILRCTSKHGRPAPNITWFYRGQTFSPTNTLSLDQTTETYTVVSVLQRPVSAEDNGQTATCKMSHTTLTVPFTRTIYVDVKISVAESAMHVSAGGVQPGTSNSDVYSTPQTRGHSDPSVNVYAVVSKTKKGLPGIPYVAETSFYTSKTSASNPPFRSMKNVNDDGMIYSDVEFDSTANNEVIHGLDDVTIYVDIDHTKTAEPLPVRAEESTQRKRHD